MPLTRGSDTFADALADRYERGVGIRRHRADLEHLLIGALRSLEIAALQKNQPQTRYRAEVPGFERQGALDVRHRCIRIAQQIVHRGPLVPTFSEIRGSG